MFHLNMGEYNSLRSQIVTLKKGRGKHRKYPPLAFTEQGVAMLSSVLNSEKAIEINIQIIKTFVKLRDMIRDNRLIAEKIAGIEKKLKTHEKAIIKVIEQMSMEEEKPKRQIGF